MRSRKTFAAAMLTTVLACAAAPAQNPAGVPPGTPGGMEQKAAQFRAAQARNTAQLRHYQWLESTTVTVNGHQSPPRQALVRYAADGQTIRTPVASAPPPMPSGGPLRRHIMENKMEQAKAEVEEVGNLVHAYLPPNPEQLQSVMHAGKTAIEHDSSGMALVLYNYAKPGDRMRLVLDPATMQIMRIEVSSYFKNPKDSMTATVRFANLPDRTTYPAETFVEAPGKKVNMVTTNADYVRVAQ
ncbi:hypothetical protein [Silvibacterium acidisoli]|uniref:hypothetical protein n=1 Tax=Acidobacteriaceae bacterium ZG23-2 TaxID=2883246 RepID=UPI00406BEF39